VADEEVCLQQLSEAAAAAESRVAKEFQTVGPATKKARWSHHDDRDLETSWCVYYSLPELSSIKVARSQSAWGWVTSLPVLFLLHTMRLT